MSAVRQSEEWRRIVALPVREYPGSGFAEKLTRALENVRGARYPLRDNQALALADCGMVGGGFFPIKVGGGKTLISLLAPLVMKATRPVLLLPASLIEKTVADRARYAQDGYAVAHNLRLISYESLGRVRMADELTRYRPDLIIADECHRLKNRKAACTRRVSRYMHECPETRFLAMSGTIMKHSIRDFAHIIDWCLKDGSPLPRDRNELEDWANALDDLANPLQRVKPGPLGADLESARAWFAQRLRTTAGVVVHDSGQECAASLRIAPVFYDVNQETEDAFKRLRECWETPNGYAFSEAIMLWKFARELALGHWIEWDPPAPQDWLNARREWAAFARETLSASRSLDTELQVRQQVIAGELDGPLQPWLGIQDTYTPNPVDRWHDDSAIIACEQWAEGGSGIIYTGHSFFGRALARRLGAPYYGEQGQDDQGRAIETELGDRVIVASLQANGTGRNLQAFSRALVTTNLNGGDAVEQLIGRLHRSGQKADEIRFDFLMGCWEHLDGFWRAHESTLSLSALTGVQYKLMLADVLIPRQPKPTTSMRWRGSVPKKE